MTMTAVVGVDKLQGIRGGAAAGGAMHTEQEERAAAEATLDGPSR
jgi:hypothetical protein